MIRLRMTSILVFGLLVHIFGASADPCEDELESGASSELAEPVFGEVERLATWDELGQGFHSDTPFVVDPDAGRIHWPEIAERVQVWSRGIEGGSTELLLDRGNWGGESPLPQTPLSQLRWLDDLGFERTSGYPALAFLGDVGRIYFPDEQIEVTQSGPNIVDFDFSNGLQYPYLVLRRTEELGSRIDLLRWSRPGSKLELPKGIIPDVDLESFPPFWIRRVNEREFLLAGSNWLARMAFGADGLNLLWSQKWFASSIFATHPDRNWIFAARRNRIFVLDSKTGRSLGRIYENPRVGRRVRQLFSTREGLFWSEEDTQTRSGVINHKSIEYSPPRLPQFVSVETVMDLSEEGLRELGSSFALRPEVRKVVWVHEGQCALLRERYVPPGNGPGTMHEILRNRYSSLQGPVASVIGAGERQREEFVGCFQEPGNTAVLCSLDGKRVPLGKHAVDADYSPGLDRPVVSLQNNPKAPEPYEVVRRDRFGRRMHRSPLHRELLPGRDAVPSRILRLNENLVILIGATQGDTWAALYRLSSLGDNSFRRDRSSGQEVGRVWTRTWQQSAASTIPSALDVMNGILYLGFRHRIQAYDAMTGRHLGRVYESQRFLEGARIQQIEVVVGRGAPPDNGVAPGPLPDGIYFTESDRSGRLVLRRKAFR